MTYIRKSFIHIPKNEGFFLLFTVYLRFLVLTVGSVATITF